MTTAAMSRVRTWPLLFVLALLGASCVPEGLAFVQDDRLEIVAPEGNTEVDLPLTIRWRVRDFHVTGRDGRGRDDAGYFGIFLDGTPVPPGKPLEWVAREDRRCLATEGCPNDTYLADRLIWHTTETRFTFEHLPDLDTTTGRETHEVTIILLDGTGRRIGESAWYVTFFYQRPEDFS